MRPLACRRADARHGTQGARCRARLAELALPLTGCDSSASAVVVAQRGAAPEFVPGTQDGCRQLTQPSGAPTRRRRHSQSTCVIINLCRPKKGVFICGAPRRRSRRAVPSLRECGRMRPPPGIAVHHALLRARAMPGCVVRVGDDTDATLRARALQAPAAECLQHEQVHTTRRGAAPRVITVLKAAAETAIGRAKEQPTQTKGRRRSTCT